MALKKVIGIVTSYAGRITLVYLVVGALWILFSDLVVSWLAEDEAVLSRIQSYKGLAFIGITAALLFLLIRQAETSLLRENRARRDSERRLHAIFDHHYQLTGLLDRQGRVLAANKTVLGALGVTEADILGQDFWDCPWWEPAQQPEVRRAIEEAATGKFIRFETTHRAANGERRDFDFSLSPVEDENGKVIYLVPEGRDITEMKQSGAALRESEEKYRLLFASSNDGILVLGGDPFTFLDCNQRACDMLGCTREQIIGETPWRISPELQPDGRDSQAKARDIIHEAMQGHARLFEWRHLKYDGTPIDIEVSLNRMESSSGVYIQTIWRDITERKLAERQRERLLHMLAAKNEELESIIYVSSHDLRIPLVNIQCYAGLLSESCGHLEELIAEADLPKRQQERIRSVIDRDIPAALDFVESGARTLDTLQKGLLRLCRLGRMPLKVERIDVSGMLADIVANLRSSGRPEAEVTVGDVPVCYGDHGQILLLFTSLLDNAFCYLDPERKGSVSISGRTENGASVYCVEDNGIGIGPEHYDKVFEVFYRLAPKGPVAGEGLGLTIARRVADRHGGKVWLASEVDKGSCFFVSLPDSPDVVSAEMLPALREL